MSLFARKFDREKITNTDKNVKKQKNKIKIYTRSMNIDLYNRAMFFVDLPYPKVRLINTTADGYLYRLVMDEEADWIINIDEDAFIYNMARLKALLNFVIENNYVNCGMPDGGVVHLRRLNPLVTNPYFNILNTKEIRKKISEFKPENYMLHKEEYMTHYPTEILKGSYEFVYDSEPYYPFFVWLSQNFKTLYLSAENHLDGESTILLDNQGNPFLIHAWYSRFYGNDYAHTKRINKVVCECELSANKKYKVPLKETLKTNIKLYKNAVIKYLVQQKKKTINIK